MTDTTIRLMSESDAMRAVGVRSAGMWTFSVVGERTPEVMAWVEAEPLRTTMVAHWLSNRLMAAYVMFERDAHSEASRTAVSSALTMFATAFKGAEGFDWQLGGSVPGVGRVC